MNSSNIIAQSRKHYRRFYRLVVGAVVVMTAVLTGSLLLGDSVRGTLVKRVGERLGPTETIITSGTGFMSESLAQHPLLKEAQGCLLMDGFVSVDDKLLPVYVWGTDDESLAQGEVMINEPLRARLKGVDEFVLHLPSHNQVSSGSLFVTRSYATQMRVSVAGVKSVEDGGNRLLKNEQTLPLNVFIGRRQLAEEMSLEGKINLILSRETIRADELDACWTPELSGIQVTDSSLTCEAVFIPRDIVEKIQVLNAQPSIKYFSYLVNDLASDGDTIPYSFVTAVTEWQGERLDGEDVILSDYAARRLHLSVGDSVAMSYFVANDLKNLETHERRLRVKGIVPLTDFMRDSLLMADFPGLSQVKSCTEWDSDLPIRMDRVKKEDEDYWAAYRQTAKAIVSYEAVGGEWTGAFGSATALRFPSRPNVSLTPGDAGVQIYYPRAQGLAAATGGVDFAGLFLSLGIFIILAAILLMVNPLAEMFTQRRDEIQLYWQMGFRDVTIRRGLFRESFSVMLLASPLSVIAGILYSCLTLWLLSTVWSGATHTESFALHVRPLTLLMGWAAGIVICAVTLCIVLRSQFKSQSPMSASPCAMPRRKTMQSGVFFILLSVTLALIAVNFICFHSMALFIVCGLLWLLTWGLFLRVYVERRSEGSTRKVMSRSQLMWQSVRASLKQHILAYWALALGLFAVFAVGLNRPDFSRAVQATGGYQLYVDSRVPIHYDLNHPAVRRKLSLQSLPDSTWFLSLLRHTQDEASCLNLNQVGTPTVLGVDLEAMEPFGLVVQELQSAVPKGEDTDKPASVYIDQESLMWSMKKSVGDMLYYQNDRGESVPVVIAGTYPTGIFHGNALMSSECFRRLWPQETGVEVLLVKSSHPDEAAELLATALNEYGLNVETVEERLKMFFEVTETYLIIFLTLGGLGFLLGIFSLIIIVRKNITAQAPSIRLYCAMGFSERLIILLLLRENLLVPFYAICVGFIGSVISISANVGGAGVTSLLLAFVGLIATCLLLFFGLQFIINQSINKQLKI